MLITTFGRAGQLKGGSILSTEDIKNKIIEMVKGIERKDILIKIYTFVKAFC